MTWRGSQVRSLSRPPPSPQGSNSRTGECICPAQCGLFDFALISAAVSATTKPGFLPAVSAMEIPVPEPDGDRFQDWVAGTQFDLYQLHHPLWYFVPFGDSGEKAHDWRGFRCRIFGTVGLRGWASLIHRPGLCRQNSRSWRRAMLCRRPVTFGVLATYTRARPSLANCWDHSAGGSRSSAIPMPLGRRPSMAAVMRAGARKAIESVRLIWRTLQL